MGYARGATVASFKTGGVERLGMRGDAKLDGSKKNVSGGIPICFPQFGRGDPLGRDVANPETAAIPCHGLVRNMDWELVEESLSRCVLEVTDTDETRKVWPHRFRCRCTVQLQGGKLRWELEVTNTSATDFAFTCGIHSYFATSDVDRLRLTGPFKGSTRTDRKADPPASVSHPSEEVRIRAFTDDIYAGPGLPGTITLHDPALPPLDVVGGGGWRDVVVWNPHGDHALGYKAFVCVESVAARRVVVRPAACWAATLELTSNPIA